MWICGFDKIGERCKCGEQRERQATKLEEKKIRKYWKESNKDSKAIHVVYHDYVKRIESKKLLGYDLMLAVEKWAKKWPNDVIINCVDDDFHMGSNLIFILHKSKKSFFGTTVIPIMQKGDPAIRYFMYPGHLNEIMKTLQKIQKITKSYPKERDCEL